jgi:hypothetical protein
VCSTAVFNKNFTHHIAERSNQFVIREMSPVISSIEYLKRLPLYDTEKPYWCMLTPREGFDPDKDRLDNLEFELHDGITITDIRDAEEEISLEKCGFQVLSNETSISSFESEEDVKTYKCETEKHLEKEMGATFVKTYELRLRKNIPIYRPVMNIVDPMLYEGPARGAHNGESFDFGQVR